MSRGLDDIRRQIQVSLGVEGEGVLSTVEGQMRQVQAAIEQLNALNREGVIVGQDYLDAYRAIIKVINEYERDARRAIQTQQEAISGTREQIQAETELANVRKNLLAKENAEAMDAHGEKVRLWQEEQQAQADLASVREQLGKREVQQTESEHTANVQAWQDRQKLLAAEAAAEADLANIREQLGKRATEQAQSEHADRVQAWQDQQKLLADEATAEADLANVRAALGKQETAQAQQDHDARVQAWKDETDRRAKIEKDDIDRAAQILKQQQDARKLDADVNKVIHAQARADESELTRTIELQVNPRMAAHDRYRASIDDAVKATQKAKDAEIELAQAQEKRKKVAEDFAKAGQYGGMHPDEYLEFVEKLSAAESDLVGAELKHAAAQDQVTGATKKAATAQNAMQGGTQAGANSTMAFTRAVYFAAQGIEDLQYGFNAVVNNIPMVSMSIAQGLGKSAESAMGFGAAISLVAVGLNSVVIPAVKNFIDTHEDVKAFFYDLNEHLNPFHVDAFSSSLEKMKDRIKELENKTIRVAVDDAELKRLQKTVSDLEKAVENYNRMMGKQSESEAASGKAVEEAVTSPEGKKALSEAQAAYVKQAVENNPELAEKRRQMAEADARADKYEREGGLGSGAAASMARGEADRLRQEIQNAVSGPDGVIAHAQAEYAKILLDAQTGTGAQQAAAQKQLADSLAGKNNKAAAAIVDNSAKRIEEKQAADDEAEAQFDAVEESNKRAKEARVERQKQERRQAKEASDDAEAQFQSVEESNNRARAARLKRNQAQKKEDSEAERRRKQMEGDIDDTGVQDQAFALFDEISAMPRGRGRDAANSQADRMIQRMVQQMALQDPTINPVQARSMAENAAALFRRRYADQLAKQRALMGGGVGGGNGMHSVGLGPDAGGGDPGVVGDVQKGQQDANAALLAYLARADATIQALAMMQQDLAGKLRHFDGRMGRIGGIARNTFGQLNDLRQSAANTVD